MRRRALIGGGVAVLALAAWGFGRPLYYAAITETREGAVLSAPEALAKAQAGELLLVDVRRPEEWAATGRPVGSVALDMRRADFTEELQRIAGGTGRPVALICARGVRSARVANRLVEAGFTDVRDVPEGMLGSLAGPGWLARGLPVERQEAAR